jgi:AP-1 complex subunit sigma 1/2
VIDHPGDIVDADEQNLFVPIREMSTDADYYQSEGDSDVECLVAHERGKSKIRTMSEGVMDGMDI